MPGKTNLRILYLSYDGMTDQLGQSQVMPYLVGLSKLGYSFTILSFEKPWRFKDGFKEVSAYLKANHIEWVPLMYTQNPPVLSTVWDLLKMRRIAFKLYKQQAFDIVHCRSYVAALIGLSLKRRRGAKFVFDMRGFWADERIEGGIWNYHNPVFKSIYKFFKKKEKEFLSEADYTISLTQKAAREIHTWQGVQHQPVPIKVIPCCADLDVFSPQSIDTALLQQLKQKFSISDNAFVLSYLGSIGTWYMLDEMLDFFKCLLMKRPDAKFFFITNDDPASIIRKADAKGVSSESLIIAPAKRDKVPTFLALSNWSVFFIKPIFSKLASSPTKQGEIMGMGIPHVCNTGVGDVDEVLEDGKSGVLVKGFNTAAYQDAIELILNRKFDENAIRENAVCFYSLETGIAGYNEVYNAINQKIGT